MEAALAEARLAGLVGDRQYQRHRRWVRALGSAEGLTEESDAAVELREAIRAAAGG